jgi:hypothetical protein
MRFQFPRTVFVATVEWWGQVRKINEEIQELACSVKAGESEERQVSELLDIYQAVETMLMMYEGKRGPLWLEKQVGRHVKKNSDRGYYCQKCR